MFHDVRSIESTLVASNMRTKSTLSLGSWPHPCHTVPSREASTPQAEVWPAPRASLVPTASTSSHTLYGAKSLNPNLDKSARWEPCCPPQSRFSLSSDTKISPPPLAVHSPLPTHYYPCPDMSEHQVQLNVYTHTYMRACTRMHAHTQMHILLKLK